MESIYELNPIDIPVISEDPPLSERKVCPGLQRFCPHFMSSVCDVKYSECVLLNSLRTSETLLRTERGKMLRNPTPENLSSIAQINEVLGENNPEMTLDPAAIVWNRRKGRLVAALFFFAIFAVAALIYMG